MSEKALKSALGVLAGLVLVYALVLLSRSGGGGDSAGTALARGLAGLSPEGVESVTLTGPSDSVELVFQGGAWTVNGRDRGHGRRPIVGRRDQRARR